MPTDRRFRATLGARAASHRGGTSLTPDPHELLAHAPWLRSLARSLVRDEAEAEDLVQDTWSAALASPPPPASPLGPWLARVLRNRARQDARGAGRRREREERGAAGEGLPPSEELVERMELQRLLVEGVLALDEPYRGTVVLRYYEGLSAAEIARRRGLPAATVRSHLARALAQLREFLDRSRGGRGAWAPALASWSAPASTVPLTVGVASVLQGMLAMNTLQKVGAAAAVVVAAYVGWGLVEGDGSVTRATDPVGEGTRSVELSAPPDRPPSPDPRATEPQAPAREALAAQPAAAPEPAPASGRPTWEVRLRVLDPGFEPIAGAELAFFGGVGRSAEDGRVALEVEAPPKQASSYIAQLGAEGYERKAVQVAFPAGARELDLGDVLLGPGGDLAGRLVGPEGQPIPGGRVRVCEVEVSDPERRRRSGPGSFGFARTARSGDDGRFRIEGLAAGATGVWFGAPGFYWTWRQSVEVPAGREVDLGDVELEPADPAELLAGRVLDPEGQPMAGVHARIERQVEPGRPSIEDRVFLPRTDGDGRFQQLVTPGGRGRWDVHVDDPQRRWPRVSLLDVRPGGPELELTFAAGRELTVLVTVGEEPPPGEIEVAVLGDGGHSWLQSQTSTEGRVTVLEPRQAFQLRVRGEGAQERTLGPIQPGDLDGTLEVDLSRVAGIFGRVLAGGEPVVGAEVALFEDPGPRVLVFHLGFQARTTGWPDERTSTDDQGRFRLTTHELQDYILRASVAGRAPAELELPGVDPLRGVGPLELVLPRGGTLTGRVRPAAEESVVGAVVAISRGDAHPQTQVVGPDGEYRFEHLMPGPWKVELLPQDLDRANTSATMYGLSGERPAIEFNAQVWEGQVTRHDLDLGALPRSVVTGSLWVDGAPAAGWTVELGPDPYRSGRAHEVVEAVLDERGGFALELRREGSHRLEFRGDGLVLRHGIELDGDQQLREFRLATGRLSGRVDSPGEARRVYLSWEGEGGLTSQVIAPLDDAGRFDVPRLPAGVMKIRLSRPAGQPPDGEVVVPAGGEATVGLP